jgi:hypothetical protein
MANSVTIHCTTNGSTYAITLQKTGPDSASVQLQQLTPSPSNHTFKISQIEADSSGTQIDCEADVLFGFNVTCAVDNSNPSSPTVNVSVPAVNLNNKYQVTPADYTALTQYIIASQFPPLTA